MLLTHAERQQHFRFEIIPIDQIPEQTLPQSTQESHSPPRITPLQAADLPAGLWSAQVRIKFGQCDAAGIVYTPNYFDIFNWVIEDWYGEALGIDYYALLTERRIGLGYGHASCEFLVPSRMGEVLDVAVRLERIGRSSLTLVLHAMKQGREVVRGRFVSVATALDTHSVVPIPPDLRVAIEAYQDRSRGAAKT